MKKLPTWKQNNPFDQLVVLRGALEGHLSNFQDGTIGKEKFCQYSDDLIEQIKQLEPFLKEPDKWFSIENDKLREMENKANGGRGIVCVNNIIDYLDRGRRQDAINCCLNEHDKIRNYPEIKEELKRLLPELINAPGWKSN